MAVLILAKHDNSSLNDATAKTVTAAKAMGGDITVLVAGNDCARGRGSGGEARRGDEGGAGRGRRATATGSPSR